MGLHVEKPPYKPGEVIQVVNFQTGAVADADTQIPYDDTIPTNTEGDEYMTLAITPKFANSKLKIEVVWIGANTGATAKLMVALLQDDIAEALASVLTQAPTAYPQSINFNHYMVAGTVSPITFKVRAGSDAIGTTTFNGVGTNRKLGGSLASSITITEIKA